MSSTRMPSSAAAVGVIVAPILRMTTSSTLFAINGPVATLTFNRPEARNALTWEMYDALVAACERVDATPEVRVFVIRGAGKAFAAGTDISQFTTLSTAADAVGYERRLDAIIDRVEDVRVATIAQVEGVAGSKGWPRAVAARSPWPATCASARKLHDLGYRSRERSETVCRPTTTRGSWSWSGQRA